MNLIEGLFGRMFGSPTHDESVPAQTDEYLNRTYLVIAQWPDRRVTYIRDFDAALETERIAFASGASSVTIEPEWGFR